MKDVIILTNKTLVMSSATLYSSIKASW